MTDGNDSSVDRMTLLEDLLIEGLVDWLDASWIYSRAMVVAPSSDREVWRLIAWGAVAELVCSDLAVIGDLDESGEFVPRSGSKADLLLAVFERWEQAWGDEPPEPGGSVAWLSSTEKGDEIARSALHRRPLDP